MSRCALTNGPGHELSPIESGLPAPKLDFYSREFHYDLTDIKTLENFQIAPYPPDNLILD